MREFTEQILYCQLPLVRFQRLPRPLNVVSVCESIEIVSNSGPIRFGITTKVVCAHKHIDCPAPVQNFADGSSCKALIFGTIS
jgi:hypothetical protein